MNTVLRSLVLGVAGWLALSTAASATCRDAVVLIHGNSATPASFDNTYDELRRRGYAASEIVRQDWGSKTCAACNDHNGSEETPVLNALVDALARSCTGKIDVVGHSMGVTLADGRSCATTWPAAWTVSLASLAPTAPAQLRHVSVQRGHQQLRPIRPVDRQPHAERHCRPAPGQPHVFDQVVDGPGGVPDRRAHSRRRACLADHRRKCQLHLCHRPFRPAHGRGRDPSEPDPVIGSRRKQVQRRVSGMDELSDTPVWKLQRSYYGWMFIRNVSDPLSYRACHDRIWIQPCQTCKQDKLRR